MSGKPVKICPYCARSIRGKNSSILEVNYALHTKKHELQGDELKEGILRNAARGVLAVSGVLFSAVGWADGAWLVKLVNTQIGLELATILVCTLAILKITFELRSQWALGLYHRAVYRGLDWAFSIVIGGIGKAWFNLFQALIPFYQNPWIIFVLVLYFGLVLDVMAIKHIFLGRSRSRWTLGRFIWSH
jgi:hypothetical protein